MIPPQAGECQARPAPKLSHYTVRCLKPKLQICPSPRNSIYILLAAVAHLRSTQRTESHFLFYFVFQSSVGRSRSFPVLLTGFLRSANGLR